jgi:uncharacterized protein YunC (DUF1805 family)
MIKQVSVKTARGTIEALCVSLQSKNLILLRGSKGYVMCGYLDLSVAEESGDAAVRITSVSTIEDALSARVQSCTTPCRSLGIREGQPVKEVLDLIT